MVSTPDIRITQVLKGLKPDKKDAFNGEIPTRAAPGLGGYRK